MEAIHRGIDRGELESRLASHMDPKKAKRLSDEVSRASPLILIIMRIFSGMGDCL